MAISKLFSFLFQKKNGQARATFERDPRLLWEEPPELSIQSKSYLALGADLLPEERRFFEDTELMGAFLNLTVCGRDWRIIEIPYHTVKLGTLDEPQIGRNFKVYFGAAQVGEISIVPSLDLPLNFHPAATGARFVFTPVGAG